MGFICKSAFYLEPVARRHRTGRIPQTRTYGDKSLHKAGRVLKKSFFKGNSAKTLKRVQQFTGP